MTTRCRIEGLESRVLLAVPALAAGVQMQAGGSALHVSWDAAPEVADWNGDGTQDLLVGQYTDGNIWYFSNNGDGDPARNWRPAPKSGRMVVRSRPPMADASGSSPQAVDWNNDGKLDLITGEWDGHVRVYLDTGTALGAYSYLQVGGSTWIDSSGFTKPEVCDWNNDGKKDLVVGDNNGVVYLLLNTGTIGAPAFAAATSIYNGSLRNHWRNSPVVTDFDGDGKKDLLYGEYYGGIYYCPNTGTDSAPVLGTPVPVLQGGTAINLGYAARPAIADWTAMVQRSDCGRRQRDVYLFQQQKVNRAPTDLALSPSSIAESQPVGTSVGAFSTTDPDAGDTFTYSLVSGTVSTDNGSFTISGSTLKSAAIFNYSSKNIYTIRVRTTDQGGLNAEKAFTVTVTNGNGQPTDIALSGSSVQENQPAGTTVGTLSTTDPDVGDTFMYSLVSGAGSTNNASFTISGNTLKTAGIFDYESQSSYSIRVAFDGSGRALYGEDVHNCRNPSESAANRHHSHQQQRAGESAGRRGGWYFLIH